MAEQKPTEQKKPEKKEIHHASAKKQTTPQKEGFKGIVRIAGKDLLGHVKLRRALTYVRGIGTSLSVSVSNVLQSELNLSPEMQVGELSEEQIEKIDQILFNLHAHNIPSYLLNRNRDVADGTNKHVIMNDLIFALKQDVEREKKLYTWKGYRHHYGQKVRGQRTRNTGRTGMAVGVLRKSIIGAAAAAAAPAAAGGKAAPAGGPAPAAGGAAAKPAGGAAKAAAPAAPKTEAKK